MTAETDTQRTMARPPTEMELLPQPAASSPKPSSSHRHSRPEWPGLAERLRAPPIFVLASTEGQAKKAAEGRSRDSVWSMAWPLVVTGSRQKGVYSEAARSRTGRPAGQRGLCPNCKAMVITGVRNLLEQLRYLFFGL